MSKANNNPTTSTAAPHKHQTHQYGTTDSAHDNAYIGESSIVGAHAIPPQLGTQTHHSQSKTSSGHGNHQYGGPENEHDNAYISEAVMAGTHAIPPMTFHARHDLKEKLKRENHQKTQPGTE